MIVLFLIKNERKKKLSLEKEEFIYRNHLEKYSIETINSILKNYDYLVHKGLL